VPIAVNSAVPLSLDRPYWLKSTIDVDSRSHQLPQPAMATLMIGRAAAFASFDRSRPLYEMTGRIPSCQRALAVFTKIHHAVIDGQLAPRC
jgi:hypothetical protein